MTEEQFWKTTPRKFFALVDSHNRANCIEDEEEKSNNKKVEPLTLEELMAMH
jgi:hypothetical protein